jgi:steroid 5-alpha reductase family enzyme
MSFWTLFFISEAVIFALVFLLWLLSLRLKNASIIDIFWGTGFVIIAWIGFLLGGTPTLLKTVLLTLVTIWGLRLSIHIYRRNHGKPEDFRYAAWRKQYGKVWWWYSFFHVFLLQAFLMWVISTPIVTVMSSTTEAGVWLFVPLGGLVWAFGFLFEALGDWQLEKFKSDPANKGKLMMSGVWQYTRHPNYFGDAAQWWGYYMISLATGAWWLIFSPIIMIFLLLRVSGVSMLEKTMSQRPGYEEYARRTSEFFPWPPKKD